VPDCVAPAHSRCRTCPSLAKHKDQVSDYGIVTGTHMPIRDVRSCARLLEPSSRGLTKPSRRAARDDDDDRLCGPSVRVSRKGLSSELAEVSGQLAVTAVDDDTAVLPYSVQRMEW
jgi:hypothetical protein